jgi:hypothetical protein
MWRTNKVLNTEIGSKYISEAKNMGAESMVPRLQALSVRAYENMAGIAMVNPPGKNRMFMCV